MAREDGARRGLRHRKKGPCGDGEEGEKGDAESSLVKREVTSLPLYWQQVRLTARTGTDAMLDAGSGEGGHEAARLDGVIHRNRLNRGEIGALKGRNFSTRDYDEGRVDDWRVGGDLGDIALAESNPPPAKAYKTSVAFESWEKPTVRGLRPPGFRIEIFKESTCLTAREDLSFSFSFILRGSPKSMRILVSLMSKSARST